MNVIREKEKHEKRKGKKKCFKGQVVCVCVCALVKEKIDEVIDWLLCLLFFLLLLYHSDGVFLLF